jgi:hypothetical protein
VDDSERVEEVFCLTVVVLLLCISNEYKSPREEKWQGAAPDTGKLTIVTFLVVDVVLALEV